MTPLLAVLPPREWSVTDDELIAARFARGDDDALADAYRRWSPLVYTVSRRSTGNDADAADVTQAAFVSAWRGRAGFDPDKGSLSTWLLTITKRRIADHWEERSREVRRGQAALMTESEVQEMVPPLVAVTVIVMLLVVHLA